MIEVCDIVEHGLDSFGNKSQTWRVTHHLKRVEDTLDEWKPKDILEKVTKDVGLKFREEDRRQREKVGLPCSKRYKLIYCLPEEATHVSLVSVCGCHEPISECKKVGVVEWNKEMIEQKKKDAVSEFWLKNDFPADWYWE